MSSLTSAEEISAEVTTLHEQLLHANSTKSQMTVMSSICMSQLRGADLSSLFQDVIALLTSNEYKLKKLVYTYLLHTIANVKDKTSLVVARLLKDAEDKANPLIRALAVRTLCSATSPEFASATSKIMELALKDEDPFVRKAAVLGVAKIYRADSVAAVQAGYLELLANALGDSTPQVVAAAVAASVEVIHASISPATVTATAKTVVAALSSIVASLSEASEWGQAAILEALGTPAVAAAIPPSALASLLETVAQRLYHDNIVVRGAACRAIMAALPAIEAGGKGRGEADALAAKVGSCLEGLASSDVPEVQFVALRTLPLLIQTYPTVTLTPQSFFISENDAPYVKLEKVTLLTTIVAAEARAAAEADPAAPVSPAFKAAVNEISVHITDIDANLGRAAVRALGDIALGATAAAAADVCVTVMHDKIVQIGAARREAGAGVIDAALSHVVQEAFCVMRDVMRAYPGRHTAVVNDLVEHLETLDEPAARAAFIWIVGEIAASVNNTTQLLDFFIDTYVDEDPSVQMALLTATVKAALTRKDPELTATAHKLITDATEQPGAPDVRERAFMLSRLLALGDDVALRVLAAPRPAVQPAPLVPDGQLRAELVRQAGSIAASLRVAPEMVNYTAALCAAQTPATTAETEEPEIDFAQTEAVAAAVVPGKAQEDDIMSLLGLPAAAAAPAPAAPAPAAPAVAPAKSAFDDLFGLPAPAPAAAPAPVPKLPLVSKPDAPYKLYATMRRGAGGPELAVEVVPAPGAPAPTVAAPICLQLSPSVLGYSLVPPAAVPPTAGEHVLALKSVYTPTETRFKGTYTIALRAPDGTVLYAEPQSLSARPLFTPAAACSSIERFNAAWPAPTFNASVMHASCPLRAATSVLASQLSNEVSCFVDARDSALLLAGMLSFSDGSTPVAFLARVTPNAVGGADVELHCTATQVAAETLKGVIELVGR